MTVNVGVIGVGMIGQDHIRRLTHVLSGARVSAVTDVDLDRAKRSRRTCRRRSAADRPGADRRPRGRRGRRRLLGAHPRGVRARLHRRGQAGVLREAAGHHPGGLRADPRRRGRRRQRLVMVGFMRRYDDGYRAMKEALDRRRHRRAADVPLGAPQPVASRRTSPATVIIDTCVHDIDVSRWLLDSEVVAARVLNPAQELAGGDQLQDPCCSSSRWPTARWSTSRRRQHPLRLRHPRRGRRRDRHGRAGRDQQGRRQEGRASTAAGCPRTGGSGSSAPTTPSSRSGSTRSPKGIDRPVLVGRLRRHGGLRRRPRGPGRAGSASRSRCASSRTCTEATAGSGPTGTD